MLFPQLPRKTHVFGKNRAFLGKNKKPTRSAGKNKKKSHNINKKARKYPHFPASLSPHSSRKSAAFGKNRGFLGKTGALLGKFPCFWEKGNLVNNIANAPHALKGQKLLAQGNRPG